VKVKPRKAFITGYQDSNRFEVRVINCRKHQFEYLEPGKVRCRLLSEEGEWTTHQIRQITEQDVDKTASWDESSEYVYCLELTSV